MKSKQTVKFQIRLKQNERLNHIWLAKSWYGIIVRCLMIPPCPPNQNSCLAYFSHNTTLVSPQEVFWEMKFSFCCLEKAVWTMWIGWMSPFYFYLKKKKKTLFLEEWYGWGFIFLADGEVFFGSSLITCCLIQTSHSFTKLPIEEEVFLQHRGPCHGWSRSVQRERGTFGTASHCWMVWQSLQYK